MPAELTFDAIGAPWRIDTAEPLPSDLVAAIARRIEEYDLVYSRFRDDSLVARIAEAAGRYEFPADAAALFGLYRSLYIATDGAVTPLVGARLESLGYDRTYSLRPDGSRIPVPARDDVVDWDGAVLTTTAPVLLDVGAAGKGYLVDLVARMLRDAGIDEYVVDASGDLVHRGPESMTVALEHPSDPSIAIGVYELQNAALCASSGNRRTWGDGLHHILDGLTGEPTMSVAATWAIAPTALEADGLATGLFFRGADAFAAIGAGDFQYVRLFPDNRAEFSTDLHGEMFT
jgi:thiamine biosynthesis lipoprotein